ncbi:hypothetical protein J807_2549 [Acinetobacter sp. 25977_4]|nr:hypothetical protein J525_0707 [Acinetobacter sp. 21871]EXT35817.1 hypothetical protein J811_3459 [Acinetobacter sp. 25977_8]EXT42997.1 hypothetical protein J810_2543 [Acinetobacter sp. 25977_7]EXT49967.1 hypothetical protein J807_2549 [Acinetobacter sp. 25977_4]EXT60664.1 hypothetical protein J804_2999 [Acinetobacter sp. 25977_1]KCY48301.1 hypothetical protein J715_2807 [Acinetobacter baumannii 1571545]
MHEQVLSLMPPVLQPLINWRSVLLAQPDARSATETTMSEV